MVEDTGEFTSEILLAQPSIQTLRLRWKLVSPLELRLRSRSSYSKGSVEPLSIGSTAICINLARISGFLLGEIGKSGSVKERDSPKCVRLLSRELVRQSDLVASMVHQRDWWRKPVSFVVDLRTVEGITKPGILKPPELGLGHSATGDQQGPSYFYCLFSLFLYLGFFVCKALAQPILQGSCYPPKITESLFSPKNKFCGQFFVRNFMLGNFLSENFWPKYLVGKYLVGK